MRIAFNVKGDVGGRAVRALLGVSDVAGVGIWKSNPRLPHDRRLGPIEDLLGYDVLVTDDSSIQTVLADAVDARVPLVVATDDLDKSSIAESLIQAQVPALIGANIRSGLAHALLTRMRSDFDEVLEGSVSWTEPGRPFRLGRGIDFPRPVGPLWAKETAKEWFPPGPVRTRRLRAPVEGPWAALAITLSGLVNDGIVSSTLGVSDDREYLSAIALASGAVAMARHGLPAGLWWAGNLADPFLHAATAMGLATATFVQAHDRTTAT